MRRGEKARRSDDEPDRGQQERVAERAAEIARHTDETADVDSADVLWRVVRRSRVQAVKLRAASRGALAV